MAETNPRQNVTFPSNGNTAHGYLAVPAGHAGPGVVVIQEWWGLTDHIVSVCDRLAGEGFAALAPDLFGGRTTHDSDQAGQMMASLPVEQAVRDLGGAVDYLLGHDAVVGNRVGTVGFCMGGGFVLQLAHVRAGEVGAAVAFYAVGSTPEDVSGISCPVLCHFGEMDAFTPPDEAQQLADQIPDQAGVDVESHFYPAGHAFFNDEDHLGTYDPEQAQLAWERTLEFLRRNLTSSGPPGGLPL